MSQSAAHARLDTELDQSPPAGTHKPSPIRSGQPPPIRPGQPPPSAAGQEPTAQLGRDVPATLGRYQLLKRLAVGGMAELFLARTVGAAGFAKHFAVKRILPKLASDKRFVAMFLDEARLVAGLAHPNIVQIHDLGRQDDNFYLAMEYLHGVDVQAILKAARSADKRIPIKHALTIVTRIAAALDFAHSREDEEGVALRIIHRDIAPSNIIVTYEGGVKLVDFGVARARSNTNETETGLIKGKLSYLSPEQCMGRPIDHRSDIFALGIVLYELTTMSRLFPLGRRDKLTVLKNIANCKIPRPSRRTYPYPAELETIVMRALHAVPDQRYQSAGELLGDLERFARKQGLSLSPSELGRYVCKLLGRRPEPWRQGVSNRVINRDGPGSGDDASSSIWYRIGVQPHRTPQSGELDPALIPPDDDARIDLAAALELATAAESHHGEETMRIRLRRRWGRILAWTLLVAVVIGVVLFTGTRLYPAMDREAETQAADSLPGTAPAAPPTSAKTVSADDGDGDAERRGTASRERPSPDTEQGARPSRDRAAPPPTAKPATGKDSGEAKPAGKKATQPAADSNPAVKKGTGKSSRSRRSRRGNRWKVDDLFPPSAKP
ncbi:MAG: serine/threonine-protein kinase [Myxococcota bacterium]